MNRPVAIRCAGSVAALMVVACMMLASPEAGAQSSGSASKTNAAPAGNAENGKRIYTSYGCYQCHGRVGQGGGRTTAGPEPDFVYSLCPLHPPSEGPDAALHGQGGIGLGAGRHPRLSANVAAAAGGERHSFAERLTGQARADPSDQFPRD